MPLLFLNFQKWGNLISLLKFHIALSETLLTACVMFSICNKEHKRCLLIVYKLDIIWSNRRTPEFINYQLWTSYKIFRSLKYLFHFFGWLLDFSKSNCMLLSWHVRSSEKIYSLVTWMSRNSLLETVSISKFWF